MDTIMRAANTLGQQKELVAVMLLFCAIFLLLMLPVAAWATRKWTRRTWQETRELNSKLDSLIQLASSRLESEAGDSDPFAEYATKKWTFRTFEEARELNAKLDRLIKLAEASNQAAASRVGTHQ